MNKQESKYQKTALLMDEALLLLLENKDYDRITVKELCEKAGVNRTTFYLHYESMNDLLEETVAMINKRFTGSLSGIDKGDPSKEVLTSEKYLRPYLELIRLLLTYMDTKLVKRRLFLVGAVSLAVLVIPMTVAMVKTIREKDAPVYFFFWMIYLYATYGTVKFIMAIRTRHKARKNGDVCNGVLSWITLVSALYTMQMMEFALIATFDTSRSRSMMIMQYLTHGAILIFTLFIIVHLITAFIKAGNKTY